MPDAKEKTIALLSYDDAIDLNALAENALFTCPDGKKCIITEIIIRRTSAGIATASISCGWNTANADDVVALTGALTITQNNFHKLTILSDAARGDAADTFKFEVRVVEGGAATGSIDVFGYIVDA